MSKTATSVKSSRRRAVRRLLSSGGKLASIGLAGSLATVAFLLWIQAAMQHQIEVAEPLARLSLELRGAVNESFVELRGWVAYGEREAPAARLHTWREDIQPRLDALERAAETEADRAAIATLRDELQDIKYLQWLIEDIARTAANVPARSFYENELAPLRVAAVRFLEVDELTEPVLAAERLERTQVRALLLETDHALVMMLDDYSPAQAAQVRDLAARTIAAAQPFASDTRPDRVAIGREVIAFAQRVESVIVQRGAADWNTAETIFRDELGPAKRRANELTAAISARQYATVKGENRKLFRWSFLILALALLIGGLSGASIYVSYRLEDRVEKALARAKSLGQYVIGGRIGGGGMGQVFRAQHALLRRPAAIKVLRTENVFDSDSRARFFREVQLTSTLAHPNTIAVYDYGETSDGLLYYAMELINGVSLEALVKVSGPLPPGRVRHILVQVCGSLAEAHKRGLLHRDIKPSNIMIAEIGGVYDAVKVLDFGLVGELGASGSGAVGTPAYLAPETIESSGNASPASEIYALGAVAYYLLTGTLVFDKGSVDETLRAQVEEIAELPSRRLGARLPMDLEAIVVGCLDKDPSQRPGTAEALAALLAEADVTPWSVEDAEAWWVQYGEAVRVEAETLGAEGTTLSIDDLSIGPRTRG